MQAQGTLSEMHHAPFNKSFRTCRFLSFPFTLILNLKARLSGPLPSYRYHYRLSPRTFRLNSCTCTHLRNPPISAEAYVHIMLDRFDKVWSRLVDFTMTRDVSLAAERVVMHVRRSGIELCHLVGREMGKERG